MSERHSKVNPTVLLKKLYRVPLNVCKNSLGYSLDISYITPNIIVCSYPVTKYPKLLYRNSLLDLINYLNVQHEPDRWKIYNLKGEVGMSDYSDEDMLQLAYGNNNFEILPGPVFINRNSKNGKGISLGIDGEMLLQLDDIFLHKGWLDHCPPPFIVLQEIVDDMNEHILKSEFHVAIVHCRMGKGRSGTIVIAYLMKYLKSPLNESRDTFMNGRFRAGISKGVTILSQLRYLEYHEMFVKYNFKIQKQILKQLINKNRLYNFKIQCIELINPNNIIQLKNRCITTIKVQAYTFERNGVITLGSMGTEGKLVSEQNETGDKITIDFPLDIPYDINDIRLVFGLNNRISEKSTTNRNIKNNTKMTAEHLTSILTNKISHSNFWFNLYWESVKCSQTLSETNYLIDELKHEQSLGQLFHAKIDWNDLDGPQGTSKKGLKLFESIIIKWIIK